MNLRPLFRNSLIALQFRYYLALANVKAKKEIIFSNSIAYFMLALCVGIIGISSAVITMAYVYPTESDRLMSTIMVVGEALLFIATLHVWEWKTGKKLISNRLRPLVDWMAH